MKKIISVFVSAFLLMGIMIMPVNASQEDPGAGNDPAIIGNWEYATTQYDVYLGFYKAGFCFYEDGTGLDVFWNEPFTYRASDGVLEMTYENPAYSPGPIHYSILYGEEQNYFYAEYGAARLVFDYENPDYENDAFLYIPEAGFDQVTIMEGTESWDDKWRILTDDGETVTIRSRSMYYGTNEDPLIIPAFINGHPVRKVSSALTFGPALEYVIVEEGVQEISSEAFRGREIHYLKLPSSVVLIAHDAFDGISLTLLVPEDSYAEKYAIAHNMNYQIVSDDFDPLESMEEEHNQSGINFHVQVNSQEGYVNFRNQAGTSGGIFTEIPNGQELVITDLQYNADDDKFFGFTVYQEQAGWVSLRQTDIMKGGSYPLPDFDVTVSSDAGSINFRQSPGTGSAVIGSISNGTSLHITDMEYNASDDMFFGATIYNGQSGWVSLRQTTIQEVVPESQDESSSLPEPAAEADDTIDSLPEPAAENTGSPDNLSGVKIGDIITFGTYEQDYNLNNGQEPIEWEVMDIRDGKAFLLSKYGLECRAYNEVQEEVTWETCQLRAWLNGEFFNTAFSPSEASVIAETTVVNADSLSYGTEGGNDTVDRVFLLGLDDIINYFGIGPEEWWSTDTETQREGLACRLTNYAREQFIYNYAEFMDYSVEKSESRYLNYEEQSGPNWSSGELLRSPGERSDSVAVLTGDGGVFDFGAFVYENYLAVRPAIWVNLK